LGTRYAETNAMDEMQGQKTEQAKQLESLREQLVGKGIIVDERLLWSGESCPPNDELDPNQVSPV